MYRPVPAHLDLRAMEHDILDLWRTEDTFHQSLAQSEGRPLWVFLEGPPTANGTPGTHHVEARVFKDIFPRYRTMKGYHVPRKAGWDCHGLPVELAVEKELGFSGKKDIEAFGIEEFNARCRESVLRHVSEFDAMTHRMGFWVDTDDAYWTMNPEYIESVWWSLKQIYQRGLLVQDHRVSPYCPRCGTGLSDHELAQGYEDVVDPSVYVRFPVVGGRLAQTYPGLSLLVWTTTPWTLVSNTAVAVNPEAEYAVVRTAEDEYFIVAAGLSTLLLGDDAAIIETFSGQDLERTYYLPPFDLVEIPDAHFVILADYVTTDDGSGLVHQAPAFGAEDLISCRAYGLPVINPILPDGTFESALTLVGGAFFKDADKILVDNLRDRGLLVRHVPYEHSYPHCWRCHTALIYYAQPSWYIKTTSIKDELLRQNEATNWYPETIKWGRYGDWLNNNVDWALSRNRYWGTPLPIWRCPDDHLTVVGSLAELGQLAGLDLNALDPHRPFVDDVVITCPECQALAHRVPEVIDCWYDSGAMPFAQWGYPHRGEETFTSRYPADYICEAIDQTRGWFYTLMAIGTLVFDESAYKNVVCLGHILDEDGRKMSKHVGNVLEPISLMDEHGADAVRWFMLASGSPWQSRRVGHAAIAEVVRKVLLTYWNTASFQSLYARSAQWSPQHESPLPAERSVLDRWVLSEAHRLVTEVDEALENFDTQKGGRLISTFVDDLSNWYVRRSRRRFWDGDPAALATLDEALRIVTAVMAPFTPFITEQVWQLLVRPTRPQAPESVHLSTWPTVDHALIDNELAQQMSVVRNVVELGRAARASSGVRTRQPLSRALVSGTDWAKMPPELIGEVAAELNVEQVRGLKDEVGDLVDITVKANFRSLGKRFGKSTPDVAAAIAADATIGSAVQAGEPARVTVTGIGEVELQADDLIVTETPREGWAVASSRGDTVALDLHITDELRRAGLAREVVRILQEARKVSGLDVSDRIMVRWESGSEELRHTMDEHADVIAGEILAVSFVKGLDPDADVTYVEELDLTYSLTQSQ
ncbi:MAG: isoleucine--tRNA ligase [Actinomycetes bacterium]